MNKINIRLNAVKSEQRLGVMAHLVVGYPSLSLTVEFAKIMADSGVDIIELQIPFSDPLADGPTIMHASEVSLKNGTKVADAFTIAQEISQQVDIPLIFMTYFNIVYQYGVAAFCRDAAASGISGLIIPDMSLEAEGREGYAPACAAYDLYPIRVVSPASTENRLRKNAAQAAGFIYATARQGITGARQTLPDDLARYLKKMRKMFTVPLAVGFGISSREHLMALQGHTNMAVIGSALIDVIDKSSEPKVALKTFLEEILATSRST